MTGAIQILKPEALTWDLAFRLFMLRCTAQNLTAGMCGNYAQTFRLFRRALGPLDDPSPAELTVHHLRACMEAWKGFGLASATLDNRFRNLRAFFHFLRVKLQRKLTHQLQPKLTHPY